MTDLMREACLIDGQWVTADKWIDVDNPATGERIGRVPRCRGKQVEQAIDAAARAMIPWAQRPAQERASVLRRYFDLRSEARRRGKEWVSTSRARWWPYL